MSSFDYLYLEKCHSTQEVLKNQTRYNCVWSNGQTNGRGRRGNTWIGFKDSLALSVLLPKPAHEIIASIKWVAIICEYINDTYNKKIKVKWPNDLVDDSFSKVGGMILESFNDDHLLGLGLNLVRQEITEQSFSYKYDFIFNDVDINQFVEGLLEKLYKSKEESVEQSISRWIKNCSHLNKKVKIIEGNKNFEGIFIGLNDDGAAILEVNDSRQSHYNGSLRLLV